MPSPARAASHLPPLNPRRRAAAGDQLWVQRYDGSQSDAARDVAVSPDGGTVFVTGLSTQGPAAADYVTVAYDAVAGTQLWVADYDGPAGGRDEPSALAVSPDDSKVFVTGKSRGVSTRNDYATVAYDASTGDQLWVSRYDDPAHSVDKAAALAVAPNGGSVFVTGSSIGDRMHPDYVTVAYDASTGATRWTKRYGGPHVDRARDVAVAPDGSAVYVTGTSIGGRAPDRFGDFRKADPDWATVAYDAATGRTIWVTRHAGANHFADTAVALAVSPDGSRVFIIGNSYAPSGAQTPEFLTIAYAAGTGVRVWKNVWRPKVESDPMDLAVSPDGSTLFVTGQTTANDQNFAAATVAYDASTGRRTWVRRYDGEDDAPNAGSGSALGRSIAVSPDGSQVYVGGSNYGAAFNEDYATVAYATG